MESGRIEIGGETDEDDRYIAPTILVDVIASDTVMQEEVENAIAATLFDNYDTLPDWI